MTAADPRSTQCRWMMRLAKELTPLTDLMRSLALESPVVQADETPVKMLAPGTGKTSTTYLWVKQPIAAIAAPYISSPNKPATVRQTSGSP